MTKNRKKNDPILTCLRRAGGGEKDALIMATSDAHAREVVANLHRRRFNAGRCGKFIVTDAPLAKAFRASKLKVRK